MKKKLSDYNPPHPSWWQGRVDHENDEAHRRFHQVVNPVDLRDALPAFDHNSVCVLGFASDEGVRRNKGRVGAAEGPQALRKALSNLPVHFSAQKKIYDLGDVFCLDQNLEEASDRLTQTVLAVLRTGALPVLFGGGHEIAWGHGRAVLDFVSEKKTNQKVGIVNFDAHYDLRDLEDGRGTSGTPFWQLAAHCKKTNQEFRYCCVGIDHASNTKALFDRAQSLGVTTLLREELALQTVAVSQARLQDFLDSVDLVYLTVCLDVFSVSLAPGVSAVNPWGLSFTEFYPLFKTILDSGKVIAMDVAELNPEYDVNEMTAKLAARVVFGCL